MVERTKLPETQKTSTLTPVGKGEGEEGGAPVLRKRALTAHLLGSRTDFSVAVVGEANTHALPVYFLLPHRNATATP